MRTFLAIELPRSIQDQVQQLQRQVQGYLHRAQTAGCIRWTPAEKIHLTLRFLGATNPAQHARILHGLGEIATQHTQFALSLTALGCFPHWREPSVVWLTVQGDLKPLQHLQVQTEQLAQQAGFAAEVRAFAPHITIGRARRNADRALLRHAGSALQHFQTDRFGETEAESIRIAPFVVTQIIYMQSELRPDGAHYTPLAHGKLAATKL